MFWITFNWDKFEYIPVLLERFFFPAGRSPNIQSAIENIHLHQGLWYWLFLVDRQKTLKVLPTAAMSDVRY